MRVSAVAGLMFLSALGIACLDPARLNVQCRWVDPDSRPLDLSKTADREHLRVDAKIAGDLGLRFADARFRNVPMQNEPLREACTKVMQDSIVLSHHVTVADIVRATRARVWWVDTLCVYLPMALLTLVASGLVTRRICRSFGPEDRVMALIGTVALVPVVAGVAVGVTQFWAFSVEGMLLRNGHVSFRAFEIPVMMHGWVAFFVALAICGAVSASVFRVTPLTAPRGAARWIPSRG